MAIRVCPSLMVEEALQIAMEKRPEIHAARLQIKGRELNTAIQENDVLPKLDLFGSIGVNGLAGQNTTPEVDPDDERSEPPPLEW